MSDQTSTTAALRAWADGRYDLEAAVELLSRAYDGRLASPQHPWVVADGQSAWIDPAAINGHNTGMLSGGENQSFRLGQTASLHPWPQSTP